MNSKEFQKNNAYENFLKEKEDVNMRYVAERIHELYYMPSEEELAKVEVPEDFNTQMIEFARKLDQKHKQEIRAKRIRTIAKRAAVFLVCFVAAGTIAVSSADAIKLKLNQLLSHVRDEHIVLHAYDYSELEGHTGYYTFDKIPENYALSYIGDANNIKEIYFTNKNRILAICQYDEATDLYLDNEHYKYEEIYINGDKAFFFENEDEKRLAFIKDNNLLEIFVINDDQIQRQDLIFLAENIKKVN